MPKFTIKLWVKNKGNTTVSAHVGASLVSNVTGQEYYNAADDIKKDFAPGNTDTSDIFVFFSSFCSNKK